MLNENTTEEDKHCNCEEKLSTSKHFLAYEVITPVEDKDNVNSQPNICYGQLKSMNEEDYYN